jgi:hypothetical protein
MVGGWVAEDQVRQHSEPMDSFESYKAGKDVGNVANKGPQLIQLLIASKP